MKDHSLASRDEPDLSTSSIEAPRLKDQTLEIGLRSRNHLENTASILQKFARRVYEENAVSSSQYQYFCSSAPIIGFLSLLVIGVILPRIKCADNLLVHKCDLKTLVGMISGCLAVELIVWRFLIWVVATGLSSFCEMDLAEAFRTNRAVDTEGLELTQVDLFMGGLCKG